jgi:hypothetical protein
VKLVSFLTASSTLNMEVTYSSEMLIDFQRATWRYIAEERPLHNHRCENLKSYLALQVPVHFILDLIIRNIRHLPVTGISSFLGPDVPFNILSFTAIN